MNFQEEGCASARFHNSLWVSVSKDFFLFFKRNISILLLIIFSIIGVLFL